ncbi:hypothetical protein PoB_001487200 [Plakobranchus ocellatus]|uniref:Uncharacterized protein n=1 Tax=Plakobranchus ocellatus TaxID=259542 RepID=A0AAV3YZI8_9GAST|nr:hypothetical protein PoB_001487200 [Plakobranchus ocellatus]
MGTASATSSLSQSLPNIVDLFTMGGLDTKARTCTVERLTVMDIDETLSFREILECQTLRTNFCGPIVKSSFNIMEDILEYSTNRLTTYSFQLWAIIKSHPSA